MNLEDEKELEKLRKEKRKAEKKDNLKEVALLHNCIGELLSKYELFDEAITEHESERALSEALHDTIGEAVACRKIGECYCSLEQYDKALRLQQRHLSLAKSRDCPVEEQRAWATIGRTYLFQSETAKGQRSQEASRNAEKAFQKALSVCDRLVTSLKNEELMEMKARLFLNLGLVFDGRGDVRQSADYMKRAITLAEKYRLVSDVYRCQFSLAGMYQRNENWTRALRSLEEAQRCAVKLKDKLLESEVLANRAQVLLIIGDYGLAKHCLKKAYKLGSATVTEEKKILKMFKAASKMEESVDDLEKDETSTRQRFKLFDTLGDAAADVGNFQQAIDFYLKMLECGEELQIGPKERIPVYVSLAQTYADLKQYTLAVDLYKKELACRTDEPEQACRTWLNIAEAEELSGSTYEKISQCYLSAFQSARRAKNRKLQIRVLCSLLEVQKMFKQRSHQQQTQDKLNKLKERYGVGSGEELSDSERDSQQVDEDDDETDDDDNLSIAELTESDVSEGETPEQTTGSIRRRTTNKTKVNEKGETALHRACIEGNLKKVQNLIEKGHPVNPRDYCGWIPLHEAANHDHYEVVQYLLENGAAVSDRGGQHCGGITPLLDAANCGNTAIMKLLIKHGADVHNKDDDGETVLECLRAWYKRCKDTASREVHAEYEHMEATLHNLIKGGQSRVSNRPPERSQRPRPLLDMYDDSSEGSQMLPEVKFRSKRKRNSLGGSKFENLPVASNSEDEANTEEVRLLTCPDTTETDFYPNPRLEGIARNESATEDYRNTISVLGSASQRAAVRPAVKQTKPHTETSALLDENEFIDDDWLIDDIHPQKRKKLDLGGLFTAQRTRKQDSLENRQNKCDRSIRRVATIVDDSESETFSTHSDTLEISDVEEDVINNVSRDSVTQNNAQKSRSRLSTKSKPKQMKLNFSHQQDRSARAPSTMSDESDRLIVSQVDAYPMEHRTVASVMRLKVTVEGQMLLVPVPNTSESISWLAQDVAHRYEKIHHRKPLVTLSTCDGAILSPDDVISMVLSHNEVLDAMVDSWDMQPLPCRYRQACTVNRAVVYRNIVGLLQACDMSGFLDLQNLALRPVQVLPVFRALEGQNNLKHLNLQCNRLGDNGISVLANSLHSLPNLMSLNLTGNEVTAVGIKTLSDSLQTAHQSSAQSLKCLSSLYLAHNPIGDNSTSNISSLVSCLPSLTDLSLSTCQLTAKFFSQHRLMLEGAMKSSSLSTLNMSHNQLGSLGLEQLLRCLNHRRVASLDLSQIHCGSSISHLALHLQQYLTQDGCVLEDLQLSACHLSPDDTYFITKLPSMYKGLKKLNVSMNIKIDNSVFQELLAESVKNECSLEELVAEGCAVKSPLDSNFLDNINDKLSRGLHPLRRLKFTCSHLDKVDVDCLQQIWTDRWKELAKIDIEGERILLDVLDSS